MSNDSTFSRALKIVAAGAIALGSASAVALATPNQSQAAGSYTDSAWWPNDGEYTGSCVCSYCPDFIPYEYAQEYSQTNFTPDTSTQVINKGYDSVFLSLPDKFVKAGDSTNPITNETFNPFDGIDEVDGMTTRFLSIITDDNAARPDFIAPPDGTEVIDDLNSNPFPYSYSFQQSDDWVHQRSSWNPFFNEFFGNDNVDASLLPDPTKWHFEVGDSSLRLTTETGDPNWSYSSELPQGVDLASVVTSGAAVMPNVINDQTGYFNWLLGVYDDAMNSGNGYDYSSGLGLGYLHPITQHSTVYFTQRIVAARASQLQDDSLNLDSTDTVDVAANDTLMTTFGIPTLAISTQPSHGSVVISGSNITFTPDQTFTTSDSFKYSVTDPVTGFVEVASVNVTKAAPLIATNPVAPTSTSCPTSSSSPTVILPSTTGVDYSLVSQTTNNDGSLHVKISAKAQAGYEFTNPGSNWVQQQNGEYVWEGDLSVSCPIAVTPQTPTETTCSATTPPVESIVTLPTTAGITYTLISETIDNDSKTLTVEVKAEAKAGYEFPSSTPSGWTSSNNGETLARTVSLDIAKCFLAQPIDDGGVVNLPPTGDVIKNPTVDTPVSDVEIPEDEKLAITGVNTMGQLSIGLGALLVGAALMFFSRRKIEES